ncbi:MAG: MFS transporter [Myxococcales bacterium]
MGGPPPCPGRTSALLTRSRSPSERSVVLLVAAVQFVNILDFVMVMPLGPDFAAALGIPLSHLGYVGGAYTAAAAASGLACAGLVDRFDRRQALAVAMLGLVAGTALGGLATGMGTLLCARVVAGSFGGPATSLAFSIVADVVPASRRGKAMGVVMGAFSVAQVLGVFGGLVLAEHLGWRSPFLAVAALGFVVAGLAVFLLPPLTSHLAARRSGATFAQLVREPLVLTSWATTSLVMVAGFVLIPNIAGYIQMNLGYPRAHLGRLYAAGGVISFVSTQLSGRLVDRVGAFRTGTVGALLVVGVSGVGFAVVPPAIPVLALFMAFMFSMGMRNVAYNTLATRVPAPGQRARFLSIQSAVQHFSAAGGAFLSSRLLVEGAGHALIGMRTVALLLMALSLLIPLMLFRLGRGVLRRDRVGLEPWPADSLMALAGAPSVAGAEAAAAEERPPSGAPRPPGEAA